MKTLNIRMTRETRRGWNFLLQKGFFMRARSGVSVREFLRASLGYADALIESEVRTIFLNSSPVDDIDTARIKDGDRLALGSAMPGLVGICMGRDNPYKGFRGDISVIEDVVDKSAAEIRVSVKIFSTLAVETGEAVLRRGIEIDAHLLADFLTEKVGELLDADGLSTEVLLSGLQKNDGTVRITVLFEQNR